MKSYPKYKSSGVDWLGEIPNNWNVAKLKYLGKTLIGVTYSPLDIVDESNGILVLRSSNIQNGKADYNSCVYIRTKIPDELITRKGDILLCARNGSVELVGKNICIDETSEGFTFGAFMTVYRSKYWRFFSYFFNSEIFKAQSGLFSTSTINQLTNDTLRTMKVAFPSTIEEQEKIVDFLNYKTGQCDRFIANRQKQIELLNEQKAAIINKAVTKGINPNAKMKPSGIEWIGDIPEHWEIEPIKYSLKNIIDCEHKTAPFVESSNYLVVRTSNVKNGQLILDDIKFTDFEAYEIWTQRGVPCPDDVLLTREAPAGEACLVPHDQKICLGQRMVCLKINKKCLIPNFLISLIYSDLVKTYIDFLSAGSIVPHFNIADIKNIPIVSMPIEEQQSIVDFIKKETSKIETLISKYQKQIDLMQEYRTALISQAVTGKIDVRDWQPKTSSQPK